MKYLVLLGRIFYSFIFLMSGLFHFSQQTVEYAAGQGVPLASLAVPVSGVMAILGGLSIAVGYKARWGAWLLVLFLTPVTIMMHNFWAVQDAMMAQLQQAMFFKNLATFTLM